MRSLLVMASLAAVLAAGCSDSSSSTTGPGTVRMASGTWTGTAADSTTAALGTGGMMGQPGMGGMTWQLTQDGSRVTGTMRFTGTPGFQMPIGMMPGTFTGTIDGDQITFTMTMPSGSMMSAICTAQATGVARITGNTMTGSYSGTNSCMGAFTNGQLTLTRQ